MLHSDEAQGDSTERTEAYVMYDKGALGLATQRFAESSGQSSGSARSQADAMQWA